MHHCSPKRQGYSKCLGSIINGYFEVLNLAAIHKPEASECVAQGIRGSKTSGLIPCCRCDILHSLKKLLNHLKYSLKSLIKTLKSLEKTLLKFSK